MTHLNMENVRPATRRENLRRHREESLKTEIPVELTCAAYNKKDKNYGMFTIRVLDGADAKYLAKLSPPGPDGKSCYSVHMSDRRTVVVSPNPKGYALSTTSIQVTTMARMNALDPADPKFAKKVAATMVRVINSNQWTIAVGSDLVKYANLGNDGTKLRPSNGRVKGSTNSEQCERRSLEQAGSPVLEEPPRTPITAPTRKKIEEVPPKGAEASDLKPITVKPAQTKLLPAAIRRQWDEHGIRSYADPLLVSIALRLLKDYASVVIGEGQIVTDAKGHLKVSVTIWKKGAANDMMELEATEFTRLEVALIQSFIDRLLTRRSVDLLRERERDEINRIRKEVMQRE